MLGIFNLGLVGSLLDLLGRWVGTSWVALIFIFAMETNHHGDFLRARDLNLRQIGHVVLIVCSCAQELVPP